jgi:hypothetical protein
MQLGAQEGVQEIITTFPIGILPIGRFPVKKQRILLINLYLNQIFNTILLNNLLKQKHKESKSKINFIPIKITTFYKNSTRLNFYSLPVFPEIDKNNKQIISKVNSLLDDNKSKISSEQCSYQGGNIYRRRKQRTIKKKNRNIKNRNSLKNKIKIKINKKIKKCLKKCIKQQKQQQENKYRIKKILESKIHKKITKLKLNKTKNFSKNKSNHRKYTHKNY